MTAHTNNRPYRVAVWGPGGLGSVLIREITRHPDFDLVGVLAYSPGKVGKDAGELVGIERLNVICTDDVTEFMRLETDCVFHVARDFGDYGSLPDLVTLLSAGHNVITVHPYQHLEFLKHCSAPDGAAEQIAQAAAEGGSVFHATGSHPEFTCDRIAVTAAGLCNSITTIKVDENWDVSFVGGEYLNMIGFGQTPDVAREKSPVGAMVANYCQQNLHGMAKGLGVTLDRVEIEEEFVTASKDIQLPNILIKEGTVGRLSHRFSGYIDSQEEPFAIIEVHWMMGRDEMLPDGIGPEDYYVVSIEGIPSISLRFDIKRSLESDDRFMIEGEPTSEPGYWAIIAILMQSVPRVLNSPPGVLEVLRPPQHWTPDYRDLFASK